MKKQVCLVLGFFLLLNIFSVVSAVEIKLIKSSYNSQETLQAEISGGLIDPLSNNNIGIYLKGSAHKSPVDSGLIKFNNVYYYYAVLPQTAGDYSLKIENTKHYENNNQTTATIEKNFTITATNSSYLSFSPGYILATKDFSFVVQAFNEQQAISVEFAATENKQNFTLGYGETKPIYLSIAGLNGTIKSNIKINSYNIPVFIQGNSSSSTNGTNLSNYNLSEIVQVTNPDSGGLTVTIMKNTDYIFPIDLRSTRFETFNLDLSTSDKEMTVKPTELINFNGTRTINVTVNSNRDFNGYVRVSYGDNYFNIPLIVKVTNNESLVNFSEISTNSATCSQLGGKVCNYKGGEQCDRVTYDSTNQACCLSGCIAKKSSSSGMLWGILLLIVLGVGIWYFIKRAKHNPDSEKDISKSVDDYKKRMDIRDKDFEVRKGLTKE